MRYTITKQNQKSTLFYIFTLFLFVRLFGLFLTTRTILRYSFLFNEHYHIFPFNYPITTSPFHQNKNADPVCEKSIFSPHIYLTFCFYTNFKTQTFRSPNKVNV